MSSETANEAALQPISGWHVGHFFYRFNRIQLRSLGPNELSDGCREFVGLLDPAARGAPTRLQTWIISGHKADFGILALDPDPAVVDAIHERLLASPLGSALVPAWSFHFPHRSFRVPADAGAIRPAVGRQGDRREQPGL